MGKIARLSKAGGPYAKTTSVNKAFRTKHKISYSGPQNKAKKKANLQLREVEIPAFEALGGMKQHTSRNLLIIHRVLPDMKTWKRIPKPMYCWLRGPWNGKMLFSCDALQAAPGHC